MTAVRSERKRQTKASSGTVVFYPIFPVYRRAILEALVTKDPGIRIIGGVEAHASLTPLTASVFPILEELPTWRLGGLTWNPGAAKACLSRDCHIAIVAPAVRSLSTWATVLARRVTRRRTYLWGQCGKPGSRGVKRYLQEILNIMVTGILVYGDSEREGASELGTSKQKISVVLNATSSREELSAELEPIPTLRQRRNNASSELVRLAYVGRVINRKRLDVLIRTAGALTETGWPSEAVIIGSGPIKKDLEEFAAHLGVNIRMHDEVYTRAHLRHLLNGATFAVSPREVGLLAIDAVAHGIPIVIPDNHAENGPEVEALLPGVNALWVKTADADDAVKAILGWLESPSLPSQDLFDASRLAVLDSWSADNVANRILCVVNGSYTPADVVLTKIDPSAERGGDRPKRSSI